DMGYGDVGIYNHNSKIPTPHIDDLAREGMRFMDAHAPGAVCHPSRYGLLTGRYPFRTNTDLWPDQPVIGEGRMTIASLLRSQGYRTAMVGKWHLGFDESGSFDHSPSDEVNAGNNTRTALRQYENPLPGGPVDRGFDSFFGIRASTDIPPYFYIREDRPLTSPTDFIESNYSDGWSKIQGAFWRAGGIAPDLELIDVLPRFTEEAVRVIQGHEATNADQPIMLYVAYPAPHTPWLPTEPYEGRSGAGMYGDFMTMVDSNIGEILQVLEQSGLSEETLVIFTSDNGPVWYEEDTGRFDHDSMGGLRGMKGDAFEGGHRMPFIIRWPGLVKAGSVTHQTVSFVDLMATIADLADTDLPDNAGEDSFSLLPVLLGNQQENAPIRPPVVSVSSQGVRAIQDGQWKLIGALGSGGFTRPVHIEPGPGDPEGQLYNLMEDPGETNNLWHERPAVVDRFNNLLNELDQSGRSRSLD
ncbi:MAG: arylsulfatase, partial [Balneolales bacterium]